MKVIAHTFFGIALMLGLVSTTASARTPVATKANSSEIDISIREATRARSVLMKTPTAQAVQKLDLLLASDYGARGRMGGERNARLKSLYVQAAGLLMNGYPIAGGTLVVMAQQEPAFAQSAVGPAYVEFVNAMLAPTDHADDVLASYAAKAAVANRRLGKLPPVLQMAAGLRVMGAIYVDPIAVAAGKIALESQGATVADLAVVALALKGAK